MKHKIVIPIIILGIGLFLLNSFDMLPNKWCSKDDVQVNTLSILNDVKYLSSDAEFQTLYYRVAGKEGEKKASKYIEEAFKKSGLEVKQQNFDFHEVVKENYNTVKFSFKNGATIDTTWSKIIANGNIDETIPGKLVDLGKGTEKDFESKKDQIKGNFILIKLDKSTSIDCSSFWESSKQVKGIILYDPNFSAPSEPVIANKFIMETSKIYGEKVTTITTITKKDYDNLTKELSTIKEIDVSEYIKYDIEKARRTSQNVVATKECKNKSVDNPLIIIGAHYDCVNDPGANDNASGTAALIELTKVLSTKKLNYDVKVVAFGAEEIGLLGSKYFAASLTEDDLRRCKLMINIDGPGIGEVFLIGKSTGESGELLAQKFACQVAKKNKIVYKKFEFADSDQFYFSQVGIPTVTFSSMEYLNKFKKPIISTIDPDYHTFSDLEKENITAPKGDHSLNDIYDVIEKSNGHNSNFKKLFNVLLEVLNSYN